MLKKRKERKKKDKEKERNMGENVLMERRIQCIGNMENMIFLTGRASFRT